MARAGHADLATTQLYIDLAGEAFREEADKLGARVFADVGQAGSVGVGPSPLAVAASL
jgi:hypothetical protein